MLKRYHRIVGGAFKLIDALVIGVAWVAAYALRFYVPLFVPTKGLPEFSTYAALLPVVMGLWVIVFSSLRVYQSQRMLRRTDEAWLILRAHAVAMLFLIALTYLFSEYKYSRGVMVYFGLIGAFALVVTRLTLRNSLRNLRKKGFNLRHVLAIGEGPSLEAMVRRLEKFPEMGFRVRGTATREGLPDSGVAEKPVLGRFDEVVGLIKEHGIDMVLVALPGSQYAELHAILNSLRDETVDIRLVPDVHEYVTLGCEVEDFEGFPIVNLNGSPLEGWGAWAKRSIDILLAAIAMVVLAPVFAFIGAAIRLSSRGPVFYGQERMGLDGKTFRMFKFRSMRLDAEQSSGAVWASPEDSRKTAVGSLLRATSLDELPQLWNVLRGEMSLVGPRPERPIFVERFRHEIPHYMLRHKVKAGMTGWAQIHGWRGNTSLDRRIEYDLYYIRNWSLFLDFKILFVTPLKGFVNKNAY